MTISVEHHFHDTQTLFGFASDIKVPVLSEVHPHVPARDDAYRFDEATTRAILAGFLHHKNVLLHGYHGTGKSTHIEQVAARLNWPLVRVNLDGHISRVDLIGRDVIAIREGMQITEFEEGILPWALSRPCALLFDEYDAARPDVMFVLQRVLESDGKLTLLDQNRVLTPHPEFRLFATANTIGLGDSSGMYHGTNLINQGQMDRWHIAVKLDYLAAEQESAIIGAKLPGLDAGEIERMVTLAELVRNAFARGDISTTMSPRTLLHWGDNISIFGDRELALRYAYLNKCEESDLAIIAECYQRVFGEELPEFMQVA